MAVKMSIEAAKRLAVTKVRYDRCGKRTVAAKEARKPAATASQGGGGQPVALVHAGANVWRLPDEI